jgi:putative transposase
MRLTLQLRLLPTSDQAASLRATMRRFNAAASHAARVGFEAGVVSQPAIHERCYAELRSRFGLSAQMAVRAIGQAVEVFRHDATRSPVFRPNGAMTYDERILSFKGLDRVSLLTLDGRLRIPIVYGTYQRQRFHRIKGQVDLVEREGQFFLYATIDVPETAPIAVEQFLGVDLGIVNLAVDSDGAVYSGAAVERVRRRHHENRRRFQRRSTKGAKKVLRRLSKREANFRRHTNHTISKALVTKAKDTKRGIALEDLTYIRARTTVRRRDRARHAGWAFFQLRSFVEYKANRDGVPIVLLDPRNSSRTCSACGHCAKGNRRSQRLFACHACGHSTNADLNAARNLRAWAVCKPASELASRLAG